ncbi:MAG: hypothetical protein QOI22_547 [Verrucomicrobiota bacterium]
MDRAAPRAMLINTALAPSVASGKGLLDPPADAVLRFINHSGDDDGEAPGAGDAGIIIVWPACSFNGFSM